MKKLSFVFYLILVSSKNKEDLGNFTEFPSNLVFETYLLLTNVLTPTILCFLMVSFQNQLDNV